MELTQVVSTRAASKSMEASASVGKIYLQRCKKIYGLPSRLASVWFHDANPQKV